MINIETLISAQDLQNKIAELGAQIKQDYEGKDLTLICVLTGSVFFTIDLAKHLDPYNTYFDFMQVSSYKGDTSTGQIKLVKDLSHDIKGKHVLLVEDIIDTGLTLDYTLDLLQSKGPASLKLCTLLHKDKVDTQADYTGFHIPNRFVIGYGLDYDERYRNLNFIGVKVD